MSALEPVPSLQSHGMLVYLITQQRLLETHEWASTATRAALRHYAASSVTLAMYSGTKMPEPQGRLRLLYMARRDQWKQRTQQGAKEKQRRSKGEAKEAGATRGQGSGALLATDLARATAQRCSLTCTFTVPHLPTYVQNVFRNKQLQPCAGKCRPRASRRRIARRVYLEPALSSFAASVWVATHA